jgi:hypothetical protein
MDLADRPKWASGSHLFAVKSAAHCVFRDQSRFVAGLVEPASRIEPGEGTAGAQIENVPVSARVPTGYFEPKPRRRKINFAQVSDVSGPRWQR